MNLRPQYRKLRDVYRDNPTRSFGPLMETATSRMPVEDVFIATTRHESSGAGGDAPSEKNNPVSIMAEMSLNVETEGSRMEADQPANILSLHGWTKQDKFEFLQALKVCNSYDPEIIHVHMATKSVTEIQAAVDFYQEKAQKLKPETSTEQAKTTESFVSEPLLEWVKVLREKYDLSDLHTETSAALRIIAECEDFPPVTDSQNIDFKKIYHYIANALDGKPLPEDKCVSGIMTKCFDEIALTSESSSEAGNIDLISTLDSGNNETAMPVKQTLDAETCAKHLASQKTYNPFNIPEKFLKKKS